MIVLTPALASFRIDFGPGDVPPVKNTNFSPTLPDELPTRISGPAPTFSDSWY